MSARSGQQRDHPGPTRTQEKCNQTQDTTHTPTFPTDCLSSKWLALGGPLTKPEMALLHPPHGGAERLSDRSTMSAVLQGPVRTIEVGAGAPKCASTVSRPATPLTPLPQPPGGLSFDGLAVWSVVAAHPGYSQHQLFHELVPNTARKRVKDGIAEGLDQGWLQKHEDPQGRGHRYHLVGSAVTWKVALDFAVTVPSQGLSAGARLNVEQRKTMHLALVRIEPLLTTHLERAL